MRTVLLLLLCLTVAACSTPNGTDPPPNGWANTAPTRVEQVVNRDGGQLLLVSQGRLQTWVSVPSVQAEVGDYVLLGQGHLQRDVEIVEFGERVAELVEISHARVVDEQTARRTVAASAPAEAVAVGTVYAELDQRADQQIVVHGTVVKATSAVGSVWVHLQDGTGEVSANTHDLTVQASESVTVGQRVSFRGTLRKDVDIGFGYHYDALVEEAQVIR